MGITITAEQRDYNGFVITRDNKGNITNFIRDNLSDEIRKKNIEKFGELDKDNKLIKGVKLNKLSSINLEDIKKQIIESNRRYEKWQLEQKIVQRV